MGRFEGECAGKFIIGAKRLFELTNTFAFIDSRDVRWEVPAKARVDGASIPQVFWSVIGGPFDGEYLPASVIHDWYCDKRLRSWQDTHRVFYDAMLASAVPLATAKIMFWAVWWRGPRWEERVSYNASLSRDGNLLGFGAHKATTPAATATKTIVAIPSPGEQVTVDETELVAAITAIVERDDPSSAAIEALAENPNPIALA